LYGSEYCLLDIIRGLSSAECQFSVICPAGLGFASLLQEQGVSVRTDLPDLLHTLGAVRKASAYLRLLAAVKSLRPDLIYINQAGMLRIAGLICRLLGVPGVCQVQTLEDAQRIQHAGPAAAQVMAYICNSDFIARRTRIPADRCCVLYQGVAQPAAFVDRVADAAGLLRLGLIGRICESKGHYVTLQAAQILRSRGFRFRIHVIGDGLTPLDSKRFTAAIEQLGLQAYFDLRGYCRDMRSQFCEMDVLLIPSLAEPLGRVLYDAALHGVPVIASDAGGLGEICRLYDVGVRVPVADPERLADSIQSVAGQLADVTGVFRTQSGRMLSALDMPGYLASVNSILTRAVSGQPAAVRWTGSARPQ
ncbi:MAG: glycosyltransferase family 4 protein, partial [Planctomycetaceae bacterium]